MSEPMIRVEIDQATELAYIELAPSTVARTEEFSPEINVDLDEYGMVVGIEILSVTAESDVASIARLAEHYHIPSGVVELLPVAVRAIEDWTRHTAVIGSASGLAAPESGVLRPSNRGELTPCQQA